jgi:uncharacterized protein (UPF0147 family)
MKLFLIFLLILPFSFLSANDSEQNNYEKGLQAYKSKDFKTSYSIWKDIYLKKLSDINFNFYFGRSAYETGNYETALAAFERVDIMDNTNIQNKLETARTYFMLKMYEDSELLYKEVLADQAIPANVRRNIELSLAKVSKVQKKSFTYATVMLDYLYDSNINYASGEKIFAILPAINPVSDTALQVFANVVNIYDVGYKNGFAIKNSFSVYLKDYATYNNYNVLYFTYNPSLIYKETRYTAELVAGYDTMELGKKKYLSSGSIMPRFEFNHSPTFRSIAHFKYQRKKFEREAQRDLDANRYELSYGLQNILTPRSYVQGNLIGIQERKIRGTNLYVDFDEIKANVSYANQFSEKYSIDFYGEVRSRDYKDHSTGFGNVRNDVAGTGTIGISMSVAKTARVRLSNTYEYVNSNQDRFSYKKRTTVVGLNKTF